MKIVGMHGQLLRWWDRLLDRPAGYRDGDVAASKSALNVNATRGSGVQPTQARVRSTAPRKVAPGELTLADDPPKSSTRDRSRSLGSDPYAHDAGFNKGHGWDRVDRD